MTAPFLGPDFLLDTPSSRRLYHEVAALLPIVDFHNHLDPAAIADNRTWNSIGEIWLEGDHYKWRAMRWNGVEESLVTGPASYREKFNAFAETIPHCLGNPLYHWTHLELRRYFGWEGVFGPETAGEVWEVANAQLAQPSHNARGLLARMDVSYVGTTDDPCDDLKFHQQAQNDPDLGFVIAPSFRPDKAFKPSTKGFASYCRTLADVSGKKIERFDDLVDALLTRLDFFVSLGCKASDHGLDDLPPFSKRSSSELDIILRSGQNGWPMSPQDETDFKAALLIELGQAYAERGIVMQLHIGAKRNQSTRLFERLGPDTGGDCISDGQIGTALNALLDQIDQRKGLPRTILYCLNPSLNELLVTIAGNFQNGSEPGKIQSGPAWWFNDQLDGMERHLVQVAQMGLLSRFVGMLTDSRSFLSFPRHEYYRRLVCRMVGQWIENGSVPNVPALTDGMIKRICYENARNWFVED
ncbi:MAG: glucuronate isomerase [Roseibium sp.]|uniref:glucuronate isomerase n=1 Tax=Roseibium sp. TaxID=1936156 RepID=UPI00260B84CD|nr:glucuronate isomerase [Roseibium sp.]MCV0424792.1 glucuronate isomerase [Roseibium sp.]